MRDGQRERAALAAFGAAVRVARERRGISQTCLAKAAGLPQKHVSRIERGEVNPTYHTIIRLADALGVPISDLFTRRVAE